MKKYMWNVDLNLVDDWEVSIHQKNIPTEMILEILEDARQHNAGVVLIDYCRLPGEECFSEFENMHEVGILVKEYEDKYGIRIHLIC